MTEPTENLFRTLWTGAGGTTSSSQVNTQGTDIEMVTSYKFLGVHLNNKLDWTDHTAASFKKGQSRLYLLRKLEVYSVSYLFIILFIFKLLLFIIILLSYGCCNKDISPFVGQ